MNLAEIKSRGFFVWVFFAEGGGIQIKVLRQLCSSLEVLGETLHPSLSQFPVGHIPWSMLHFTHL